MYTQTHLSPTQQHKTRSAPVDVVTIHVKHVARGGALRSSTFEDWSMEELYELAIARKLEGRDRMSAAELARALARCGPRWRGLPVPGR